MREIPLVGVPTQICCKLCARARLQEIKGGKDAEQQSEMEALRSQLKEAESKETSLQQELKKLEQQVISVLLCFVVGDFLSSEVVPYCLRAHAAVLQVKDAQKKEQTQMAILARIKKEQVAVFHVGRIGGKW